MSATLVPFEATRPPPVGSRRLQEIADVLGVSVDALTAPAQSHILHTNEDGTCWLLTIGRQSLPVVRCTCGSAAGHGTTEESVSSFLARDVGSPQHQALIALIDSLLVMHLAR